MRVDPSCFAANTRRCECRATNYAACAGKDCPFYKTRARLAYERAKSRRRLERLPVGREKKSA